MNSRKNSSKYEDDTTIDELYGSPLKRLQHKIYNGCFNIDDSSDDGTDYGDDLDVATAYFGDFEEMNSNSAVDD